MRGGGLTASAWPRPAPRASTAIRPPPPAGRGAVGPPSGGLRRSAPGLIELDDLLAALGDAVPVLWRDLRLAGLDPFMPPDQQRLGFCVPLLPKQGAAEIRLDKELSQRG